MLAVSGLHDFDELSPLECASVQKSELVDIADILDIVDKHFRHPLFDKAPIRNTENQKCRRPKIPKIKNVDFFLFST